jgi:hypothetical protein
MTCPATVSRLVESPHAEEEHDTASQTSHGPRLTDQVYLSSMPNATMNECGERVLLETTVSLKRGIDPFSISRNQYSILIQRV